MKAGFNHREHKAYRAIWLSFTRSLAFRGNVLEKIIAKLAKTAGIRKDLKRQLYFFVTLRHLKGCCINFIVTHFG